MANLHAGSPPLRLNPESAQPAAKEVLCLGRYLRVWIVCCRCLAFIPYSTVYYEMRKLMTLMQSIKRILKFPPKINIDQSECSSRNVPRVHQINFKIPAKITPTLTNQNVARLRFRGLARQSRRGTCCPTLSAVMHDSNGTMCKSHTGSA